MQPITIRIDITITPGGDSPLGAAILAPYRLQTGADADPATTVAPPTVDPALVTEVRPARPNRKSRKGKRQNPTGGGTPAA